MGLNPFSSSKKTVVETAVLRVIEDDNMPDTLRQSLIEAIMGNQSISDTFLENILNQGVVKIDAMYAYAKTDYYYGLPKATNTSVFGGYDEVKATIEAETGYPISVQYLEFAPLSNTHIGWQTLVESYGYDHETNELTSLQGTDVYGQDVHVYLDDLVSIHTQELVDEAETGTLRDLGPVGRSGYTPGRPANGPVKIQNLLMPTPYDIGTEEGVRIETISDDQQRSARRDTYVKDTIFVPLTGYDLESSYYQCGYTYVDASNNTVNGYWTYELGSGTYPDLDTVFDSEPGVGTYFPFVFFRNQKTDLTADSKTDTEAYKTSDRLVGYLGMDYGEVGHEINQNPDIGDIEQAYMMMGVSMNTTYQLDLQYLYEYFRRLETETIVKDPDAIQPSIGRFWDRVLTNPNSLLISDTQSAMRFSYYDISKRNVFGKIGEPGTYGTRQDTKTVKQAERMRMKDGKFQHTQRNYLIPQRIYQKQINDSMYEEITVSNPQMRYDIYKGYTHTANVGEDELLIPLDKTITDEFTPIQKEEIYSRSLHFVFNSRVTQKVEWYESTFFQFVMVVVAIVVTVLTAGTTWQSIVASAGVGAGAYAITLSLLVTILEMAAYNYAFELVVKELGLEDSFLVAILAAVAAIYIGAKNGGLANSPWAQELLTASVSLTSGMKTETARLLGEYDSKTKQFALMKEEAEKDLKEAQELLDVESLLDPLSFVGLQPQTVLGEEPRNYYQRTIHQGNVGTVAFDAISSYAEFSLTLPDMNSTIGDVNNGLQ